MNIQEINQKVVEKTEFVQSIFHEIGKVIVGQDYMIKRLLIGLFADGHVLLEGVPGLAKTLSVSTLADVISKSVVTIEGLTNNGNLHPVQQAFIDHDALQCGYCTPGMILTAVAFLNKISAPSNAAIIEAMDGNLCRCGSYQRILQAIQSAAYTMQEGR